jgi:predicted nucleic acid-binding protein
MKIAYIDTSALVAIVFGEPGGAALARRLKGFDELLSSNLLEAELRAALVREGVSEGESLLTWITWVLPDRRLGPEIERALSAGYLRGADLWHVACALFVTEDPRELAFVTLDERQRELAGGLGFDVRP